MLTGLSEDDSLLKVLKCSGNENVNGGPARKCGFAQGELSGADFAGVYRWLSSGVRRWEVTIRAADVNKASFQLWASQQGDYPVRLLFEMGGKDSKGTAFNMRMEANVTDINKTVNL